MQMSTCVTDRQLAEEKTTYPIIENINTKKEYLTVSVRQSVEKINCHKIYFLESRGHNAYIYTETRELRVYQKLSDIIVQLPGYFHQCHKSYVVNFEKVARFEKIQFSMTDGRIVPVSRMHQAETKAAYQSFIESRA